jgi:hypothetical protein
MTESNQATSSRLSRDVVALGRKQAKTGFPNPNREGCPNRSILQAMADRDPRLTLANIPASHVVACSPCFRDYTNLRRRVLLLRSVRITAASVTAAAAMFIAARLFWNPAHMVEPNLPKQRVAGRSNTGRQSAATEPVPLRIDLASYSPTRGDANSDVAKKVHLPNKLLRLNLALPLGMEPGTYEIRFQDASGHAFVDKPALGTLRAGVTTVQVDIDLSTAPRGSFTLMIRPPELDWRRFPGEVD